MPTISIAPRDVARELARRYSTMTHEELDLLESILVAKKYGKNPNVWLGNVDAFVLKMSDSQYYNQPEVKYGYFRGGETYDYVNSIRARWNEYKKKIRN